MLSHIIATMKLWASQGLRDKVLQCVDLARYTTSVLTTEPATTRKGKQDSRCLPSTPETTRPSFTATPINKETIAPLRASQSLNSKSQTSNLAPTTKPKTTRKIVVTVRKRNARHRRSIYAQGPEPGLQHRLHGTWWAKSSLMDDDGSLKHKATPISPNKFTIFDKIAQGIPTHTVFDKLAQRIPPQSASPASALPPQPHFPISERLDERCVACSGPQHSITTPKFIGHGSLPIFQTIVS